MSKPDIWMPLFVADYLGDTLHLSTELHGAYLLLLMAAWRSGGSLPDDDAQLAAMAKLDRRTWARHRPVIQAFFTVEGGRWYQKRLSTEYVRAERVSEERRKAGHKGAEAKRQLRESKRTSNPEAIASANGVANGEQTGQQNATPPQRSSKEAQPAAAHEWIWGEGLQVLTSAGTPEDGARRFIGSLCAEWSEENVAEALGLSVSAADPKAYARKILASRPKKGQPPQLKVAM